MFWIENALFLAAVLVFITPAGRASQRASFLGAVALVGRRIALPPRRAHLIGYQPVRNWSYFPSVPELMVSIGIIALEILLYLVFIKILPVLHGARHSVASPNRRLP